MRRRVRAGPGRPRTGNAGPRLPPLSCRAQSRARRMGGSTSPPGPGVPGRRRLRAPGPSLRPAKRPGPARFSSTSGAIFSDTGVLEGAAHARVRVRDPPGRPRRGDLERQSQGRRDLRAGRVRGGGGFSRRDAGRDGLDGAPPEPVREPAQPPRRVHRTEAASRAQEHGRRQRWHPGKSHGRKASETVHHVPGKCGKRGCAEFVKDMQAEADRRHAAAAQSRD